MSNDDIPADHSDDSPTTDATETAADGGAVATEAPQSRFWGVVPAEWELVDGSEVYDVNPSYTPEEEEITYIEMDALDTELPFPKYATKRKAADYSGKLFREGDTLFARITPCTENGKTAFVDEMETDVGIGSTEYAVLSPDRERIHPLYLYYVAKSHPVRNYAISRMRGSTGRQRVPFDVFRREMEVSLPPIAEQRRVSSVLYNLDKSIKNVEEEVEKIRRVKKGTSQKLFSEGTREHSSLTSGKWKNRSEELPEEWNVLPAEEIMTVTRGAHPRPKSDSTLWGGEIPIIKIGDRGDHPVITSTKDNVTEKGSKKSKLVDEGTVIVSNAGTTGVPRIVGMTACIHDHWLILKDYKDQLDTRFLYHYLDWNTDYIQTLASGSTVADLNTTDFSSFEIVVPSLDEQKEIATILDDFDSLVFKNQEIRSKLINVKKALLQDLMTGSVRANDESIKVLNEVAQHG